MYKFLLTSMTLLLLLPHGLLRAQNTAFGTNALISNTTGTYDSAFGDSALFSNTIGGANNAFGYHALFSETVGGANNAFGTEAMFLNDLAGSCDAFGYQALYSVVAGGNQNAAFGYQAMFSNTTGQNNVAIGAYAMFTDPRPAGNTAVGVAALQLGSGNSAVVALGGQAGLSMSDSIGAVAIGANALQKEGAGLDASVAVGFESLYTVVSGGANTAVGNKTLMHNTGSRNCAFGNEALLNSTGNNDIGIGNFAGQNLTTGSNNIDIANNGVAGESGTIRIGDQIAHTAVYLAGINGTTTTGGLPVYVDSNGRLGIGSTIGISGNSLTLNTTGSAGAPAVLFSGDTTTGLFTSGPGDVSISAGGTDQVDVDSAGLHVNNQLYVNNDAQIAGAETLLPAPVGSQPAYSAGPESFTIVLSATTNNSSRTAELTVDGNAPVTSGAGMNVLIPPTNTSWGYCITVTAGGGGASKVFRKRGVLKNVGGTISYAGPSGSTEINDGAVSDTAATNWGISQNATAPSGRLRYTVDQSTGSAFTVHWSARVEVVATPNN